MKLPDITAWLAGDRDFKQGVALYAALGASGTYQRLFGLGANDYSRQVLVRELSALVPAPVPEAVPLPPEPPAAPLGPAPAPAPPAAEPTSQLLDDVNQQLRSLRDERSHLHPQLTAKNLGKKARLPLALRIVAITSQEATLKDVAVHVRQHGRLPGPVATADVTDVTELRQRLLNLRSRRSKLRNKPAQTEKLAAIEAEIMLIQSKQKS